MTLDLATLLYACIFVAAMAAAVMSFFGATQGTHQGYRWWIGAQWLLVLGLLLIAVTGISRDVVRLADLLVVQWPVLVLAGMRQLHVRRRPVIPPTIDWAVLVLAAGLIAGAWWGQVGNARSAAAFTLAAFITTLYGAVVVSRLGDFKHSFALQAMVAIQGVVAGLEACCLGLATVETGAPIGFAGAQLAGELAMVVLALGLVPVALALTYERTVAKMRGTHRKLRHLADVDVLTRLPNRRHFHELATRTLATTEPAAAAILMLDIENLKRINDLLGPSTGDEALRQVGLAVRETLRARDVAGRVGGDEFAAMLPDTSVADAVRVANRITDRLDNRQVAPRTARLTLNVGAVQMRAGDTIVEALRRADLALEDARRHKQGRGPGEVEQAVATPDAGDLEPRAI